MSNDDDIPIETSGTLSSWELQANQLEAQLRRALRKIKQLQGEITDRDKFYSSLQAAVIALEAKCTALETKLKEQRTVHKDLASAIPVTFCQRDTADLPTWRQTHEVVVNVGGSNERRFKVMACLDPNKLEKRYRLYQQEEYRVACHRMESQTDYRCLAFSLFEFYNGKLYHRNTPWWNSFLIV